MKNILYLIAIISIAGAAYLSIQTKDKFTELQKQRIALDIANQNRQKATEETSNDAKKMEDERDIAQKKRLDTEANLKTMNSNLELSRRTISEIENQIADQEIELAKVENLIASIKTTFKETAGNDIELSEVPALVSKLEEDLKEAKRKKEELTSLGDAAQGRVNKNNEQIEDLDGRIAKRAARIKANASEGLIIETNHDYGFAILKVPSDMPITETSELIVQRSGNYIGELKINAIEGTRVITDIDYKSMSPGMVVQRGDSVILKNPTTN